MSKLINMVKKGSVYVAAGASTALASVSSFAADHSTAITAATTEGSTNVGAAVAGIIVIAAVITGLGYVLKVIGR